jgi:hypothetical protein
MHLKTVTEDNESQELEKPVWLLQETLLEERSDKPASKLHAGDLCPKCHEEKLDYDGLLNLTCPSCGYTLGGCFT